MQLNTVKAVITGGASGLGNAVARHLVAHGAQVSLLDVQADKGEAAATELGANARFFQADVTSESGVIDIIAQAQAAMGGLNAVINCAGILGAGRVLGREAPMPLDMFARTISVNLVGSFNVAKAAANLMQHNEAGDDGERGVIVNTASVAAFDGQIGQAAYSASKGGVVGMTLPMARELARFGIRVMTIAPGIFWTPMVDGMPPQVQESLGASIPFPSRLGRPEEFADTVAFILVNRYLNGETIRLDGAVRLAPK
ncbi:SDR family NAD(P)-dependent oxidoreductase [Pseudofulvimonas gallinarii]|jgi:NAD(P)-dependent dehydrogenase (short-subunit alcohol dehydrogenase family)|uniref:NAD(P)-dependent dehydrogenase (Short-subunit alcohol dehydrogenase family) n=1 Tax=Pseudofulvimonas gallinarii TaxID=634155 RepID=A0A4R3LMC9_9GAMM|nr:SDR family NAD(P)-dependent oxidoreductase [Pseudofulvimonas gallinarii]TCT00776.1 NAD(P)-dependent dehydrogenase (short-subunit alcohol dehydrogenase family) [Pseudofulvimonas gallinarii]THD12812.1 3-hydroxyacyl-CoA dehydrogenase [Pseudofulvimonas gallinarii]